MKRRTVLFSMACSVAGAAVAQPRSTVRRIGVLFSGGEPEFSARIQAFHGGMRELGLVEGRDYVLETRFADDRYELLPALARELVRSGVDLLLTSGTPATKALKEATTTVPIVIGVVAGDPVASGLVASLARPGGNVTGFTTISSDISTKWLELTREVLPRTRRVVLIANTRVRTSTTKNMVDTAAGFGVAVQRVDVATKEELPAVLAEIGRLRNQDAVFVQQDAMLSYGSGPRVIAAAARQYRLACVGLPNVCVAGGLIGYGPNPEPLFRQSAAYVDKIFRGERVGDMPMQQSASFELAVNLKTAAELGLKIPQTLLVRADTLVRA